MNDLLELQSCKRSCELYLRALWGAGFSLQYQDEQDHFSKNDLMLTCYRVDNSIYLPGKILLNKLNTNYYRAASVHAAAHAIYGATAFDVKELNLMQRSMIDLVEDLRIELLAIQSFPGLRTLWLSFHGQPETYTNNALDLMRRLSRSVLDPGYEDNHQWVMKGRRLILGSISNLSEQSISLETGLSLANDIGQMRLPLNSGRYEQAIVYRDDNRGLWNELIDQQQNVDIAHQSQDSLSIQNRLKEANTGIQLNLSQTKDKAGDDLYIQQRENAAFEYRQPARQNIIASKRYPEWHYKKHVLQINWCSVIEQQAKPGELQKIEDIFTMHSSLRRRLHYIAKKLQTKKQQRVRKVEEGDEIDMDPMVNAMVSSRMNELPDPRVFIRSDHRQSKTLAISILLDLSESTNKVIDGSKRSISQMIRDAVLLLGDTLSIADEHFSVSGFCSNGRHEVYINNFKNFDENFEQTKERLATVKGHYSTRLGTAIRHCAARLAGQPYKKKLLLLVTDGTPSDIDVYDKNYLSHDSWHAVQSLASRGIKPFCLNLDSRAEKEIEYIFGKGRFETLERLNRLPEVLSSIYIRYGRHG